MEFENKINEIKKILKEEEIRHIYLIFVDFSGNILTKMVGVQELINNTHVSWFDGISLNGRLIKDFKDEDNSDWLVLLPDPFSFKVIPFIKDSEQKAGLIFCDIKEYEFDTRSLLKKAVREFEKIEMTPMFGTQMIYKIENSEDTQDFYKTLATNINTIFENKFIDTLIKSGIDVEYYMPYGNGYEMTDLVPDVANVAADKMFVSRWFVQNLGVLERKKIGFDNIPEGNLSTCPVHMSLWRGQREKNLFFDENGENELSELGKHFIYGILYNYKSIKAITRACTKNSLKKYEIKYSTVRDNSIIQVPLYFNEKQKKGRVGWSKRCVYNGLNVDQNYYLTFAALLYSGLYGIENKIDENSLKNKVTDRGISNITLKNMEIKVENEKTLIEDLQQNEYLKDKLGKKVIGKILKYLVSGE